MMAKRKASEVTGTEDEGGRRRSTRNKTSTDAPAEDASTKVKVELERKPKTTKKSVPNGRSKSDKGEDVKIETKSSEMSAEV